MKQTLVIKAFYLTSLICSFLLFLTIWFRLAGMEINRLTAASVTAISAPSSTTSTDNTASGTPLFGKILTIATAKEAFNNGPNWESAGTDDKGRTVWVAVLVAPVKKVQMPPGETWPTPTIYGSEPVYGANPGETWPVSVYGIEPVYGKPEGKYQWFPIAFYKGTCGIDKKTTCFKAELPSSPVTIQTGADRVWDPGKGKKLDILVSERSERSVFKSEVGAPTRETVAGKFENARSKKGGYHRCPTIACISFVSTEQIDEYDFSDASHDFKIKYDGNGKFQKFDWLNKG